MLEIDRMNHDSGLQWVFDIGWSQRFATESVSAEVPLRVIAAMIRLSQEKDALSLLDFLLDTLANAVRRHGTFNHSNPNMSPFPRLKRFNR